MNKQLCNKRIFDIIFSLLMLIFSLLPFIIIFIILLYSTRGNCFYFSKRVGLNNHYFLMPKFRTMYDNTPEVATEILKNPELQITFIGRILRKTSLDELPQIWSVLKGDMSIVGPRPALYNQFELIKERTNLHINKIKPGITGWAQVNGRDMISTKQKIQYDLYYFNNMTCKFDVYIIILTVIKVIYNKNISH
jgi:O-antigen biosynthesis protein WbqP